MSIDIYYYTCFYNLTEINLGETGVKGDILHLKSLPNLTVIDLSYTNVTGDISSVARLIRLTYLDLNHTDVTGKIVNLKSLLNLTYICLTNTAVNFSLLDHVSQFQKYRIEFGASARITFPTRMHQILKSSGCIGAVHNGYTRSITTREYFL